MMTINQKLEEIRTALNNMAVGSCGVKWDCVVWRISETGWIVGSEGVRTFCYLTTTEAEAIIRRLIPTGWHVGIVPTV